MARPRFDLEELYIAGQCVQRIKREIRAPLHILHKITGRCEIGVTANRTIDGKEWFSLPCRTYSEAMRLMNTARVYYPAAKTTREVFADQLGGRSL